MVWRRSDLKARRRLQHSACKLGQPLPYEGRRNLMAGSYSTDLRERVLVAIESGEPADVVAEAFMIGRSSVYRWIAAARDEGRRVAKRIGGGPKPGLRRANEAPPRGTKAAVWPGGSVAARNRSSATRSRRRCAACWKRIIT